MCENGDGADILVRLPENLLQLLLIVHDENLVAVWRRAELPMSPVLRANARDGLEVSPYTHRRHESHRR